MITYNDFLNEGKKKDIDPYGEENWSPGPPQPRLGRRRQREMEEAEWRRRREEENQRKLEILREKCPSGYSINQRGYDELRCDAHEFEKAVDNKDAGFAGNSMYFDSKGSLSAFLSKLKNQLNASKIEVGAIHVDLHPYPGYEDEPRIYGDAVYFYSDCGRRQVRNVVDQYEPNELDNYEGVWRVWWD